MDSTAIIAIAAIVLSLLTFIATQVGARRASTEGYVTALERRVAASEKDISDCQRRNKELEEENVRLMRRVFGDKD